MSNSIPRPLYFIFFGFIMIAGFSSCDLKMKDRRDFESSEKVNQSCETAGEAETFPIFITYRLDSLKTAAEVDSFKTRYSAEAQELIFKLNRIDAYRLNAGDQLFIPDTLTQNFFDYSPFPSRLEMLSEIPKTVLISRRVQAFGLYEQGKLIHWGAVSSGKKSTPTPAGLFYGNYKALRKISTVDDSWILPYYFNFLNFDGVGVHQYAMPGYPASHACVRLFEEDAKTIYNWAEQWKLDSMGRKVEKNGTPFMVFGDYEYDEPVPWLELAENPNSNYLTSAELQILRSYVTAYQQDPRNIVEPVQLNDGNSASRVESLKVVTKK